MIPISPDKLPPGYVDKFPKRGPWFDPASPPGPDTPGLIDIEVLLADGTFEPAEYIPANPPLVPRAHWWHFKEVHPIGWRSFYTRGHSA